MLTMQGALLALTRYWTERGCMIVQPYNTEVGAGTYNPATILRVLGPEPWHVAYVEPSVRPDDARYGQNPNRLQTHTQFQVILKPDPGDPQEIYLGSLEALGIDIHAHDTRFVEDNWASPALGAWGLGWEVWLDGLEITQFTYFQQAGGKTLDPVSVELTYGIERILMALQKVDHFSDITYAPGISYGEFFGQVEYEMSRYYLDDADVATNRVLFDSYETEAQRCIAERLPVPAHGYVLKCSHTFNVLDSRGAISTTERARAFARMRTLARQISELWDERRAELEHPLGVAEPPRAPELPEFVEVNDPQPLLFEIGVEELPPAEVTRTAEAVAEALTNKLTGTRLGHGAVHTFATPRRVIACVDAVAAREPDAERTVRGPRVSAAYDVDGTVTKAGQGFARSQGAEVAELGRVQAGEHEHVAVVRTETGRGAVEVLSGVLGEVVTELRAEKNMRWNDPSLSFSRPIRWLLALLGQTSVPVVASSLVSGRVTRVRRTAPEPVVSVPSAEGYLAFLERHHIVADPAVRRERIVTQARDLAAGVDGVIDVDGESALLDEITNMVEEPTVLRCSYAERYLELPSEILTTVMRKHQRYLPVRGSDQTLLPYVIAVADGPCDHDLVRAGNEAVLRARYEDAAFFWRADLEVSPADLKLGLAKLAFSDQLGSMAERADRIAAVADALAETAGVHTEQHAIMRRAGELAKFDLASQMVVELTSLAGTMAREYAVRAGEPEAVGQALSDMELPRTAGGALPSTVAGAVLALADRFDLLAGLFAVGANPTGSSDPFGLRRAALGVVNILRGFPALAAIDVGHGLRTAADRVRAQGIEVADHVLTDTEEFIRGRYEQQALDAGAHHRHVAAVLPLAGQPLVADQTRSELAELVSDPGFADLATALQRIRRIVAGDAGPGYDAGVLVEPAEVALHEAWTKADNTLSVRPRLPEFASTARELVGPINTFFDEVLVNADDERLRTARHGLLRSILETADLVLDWDALGTSLS